MQEEAYTVALSIKMRSMDIVSKIFFLSRYDDPFIGHFWTPDGYIRIGEMKNNKWDGHHTVY